MKWDKVIGNDFDGEPVIMVKHLVHLLGCRIDLHKIVRADDVNCFHTHPAHAIRVVLWGGYLEEVVRLLIPGLWLTRAYVLCKEYRGPGYIGHVGPDMCHRIDRLRKDASWSLWIRGPILKGIKLVGVDERGFLRYEELAK